jgi:polysaccharide export outer membrane protein
VGDKIQVVVYGQDAMSGEFEVRPGGDVALPVIGRVMAAGKGTDALASELEQRLKGVLADAHVTVILAARKPVTITVVGEVKTPGHYEVRDGEGVLEALARAGGLTPYADSDGIFVIRRAQPSPRVRFEYSKLTAADPASVGFELRDGDIVVAE